jgi:hypothetical protein
MPPGGGRRHRDIDAEEIAALTHWCAGYGWRVKTKIIWLLPGAPPCTPTIT